MTSAGVCGGAEGSGLHAQVREACWVLGIATGLAVLFGVLIPWVDVHLNPPFGRFWPWLGRSKVATLHDAPIVFLKALLFAFLVRVLARRMETLPRAH